MSGDDMSGDDMSVDDMSVDVPDEVVSVGGYLRGMFMLIRRWVLVLV